MKRDEIVVVLPQREVAVHLVEESAAAARQELRRVGDVLDGMAEWNDAR